MNLEPNERELQEIWAMLGQNPATFTENRDYCVKVWESAVWACLRSYLGNAISQEVWMLMAPPPGTKRNPDYL